MERGLSALIQKLGQNFEQKPGQKSGTEAVRLDEPLYKHTTFKIGGGARAFVIPEDEENFLSAIAVCKEYKMPYFIIGKGSNLLFPDKGFDAVVISTEKLDGIEYIPGGIRAGAGASLIKIADFARKNALTGMEFACGIPGSLGGAIRMNAGAYNGEICKIFIGGRFLDENGDIVVLGKDDMDFGYRHSLLEDSKLIALSAELKLSPGDTASISAEMDRLMAKRNKNQPVNKPCAGSVFKRAGNGKDGLITWELIRDCGLKGYSVGGAQVSELHAGFIINTGNAKSEDVKALVSHVRETVCREKGILLEPEIILEPKAWE